MKKFLFKLNLGYQNIGKQKNKKIACHKNLIHSVGFYSVIFFAIDDELKSIIS